MLHDLVYQIYAVNEAKVFCLNKLTIVFLGKFERLMWHGFLEHSAQYC